MNISYYQKYILSGFIKDGYLCDYKHILTGDMFGDFKSVYELLLACNGNPRSPEFINKVNGRLFVMILENNCNDYAFLNNIKDVSRQVREGMYILDRNNAVRELYNIYISDEIKKGKTINPKEIQEVRDCLDGIEKQSSIKNIPYTEGLNKGYEELMKTSSPSIISWGYREFDEKLGYLMGGQLVLIGGITGNGKSTFLNQICYNVGKQGFKVSRYSLEDRMEDKRKEEIYYQIGRIRKKKGFKNYMWCDFEANNIYSNYYAEELVDAMQELEKQNENITDLDAKKQVKIGDLIRLIEQEAKKGCKLFAIDHLHYFDLDIKGDRHDLVIQSAMQEINEIARNLNITILLVAHYKKLGKNRPENEDFKDGVAISQIANKIIHICRNDELEQKTIFYISKNRSPSGIGTIEGIFNRETYEYIFNH